MVQSVLMPTSVCDDLMSAIIKTDDPEIRARQRRMLEIMFEEYPEVRDELVAPEIEKGLVHQFEHRLSRPLADGWRPMNCSWWMS